MGPEQASKQSLFRSKTLSCYMFGAKKVSKRPINIYKVIQGYKGKDSTKERKSYRDEERV